MWRWNLLWIFFVLPYPAQAQIGFPEEYPIAYQHNLAAAQEKKEMKEHRVKTVERINTSYTVEGKDTLLADSCWTFSTYDTCGNLIAEMCRPMAFYEPYNLECIYNANGRPLHIFNNGKLVKEFFYDSCGRLASTVEATPQAAIRQQTVFTYSTQNGKLCRYDIYENHYRSYQDSLHHGFFTGRVLLESYAYEYEEACHVLKYQLYPKRNDSLLTEIVYGDSCTMVYDKRSPCGRRYCYSKSGQLLYYSSCSLDRTPPFGNCQFTYDSAGRLATYTALTNDGNEVETTYSYDENGKIKAQQTIRKSRRSKEVIEYRNCYDENGNLCKSVAIMDGAVRVATYRWSFYK